MPTRKRRIAELSKEHEPRKRSVPKAKRPKSYKSDPKDESVIRFRCEMNKRGATCLVDYDEILACYESAVPA
jgi:hypothetical protein